MVNERNSATRHTPGDVSDVSDVSGDQFNAVQFNADHCNAGCVINEQWTGRTVVISVAGVLDLLTSPQLEAGIAASLQKKPSAMIVDLTEVDFLASAGMGVLVDARERTVGTMQFRVVADGPATSRPLKLVGLADMIGLHPTLDAARATLTA